MFKKKIKKLFFDKRKATGEIMRVSVRKKKGNEEKKREGEQKHKEEKKMYFSMFWVSSSLASTFKAIS